MSIQKSTDNPAMGDLATVDFQGTRLEVGLAFATEASEGDWVLVHAGYALNVLDEEEALETWQYLKDADLVDELPEEMRGS